jgi:hypothetical protein
MSFAQDNGYTPRSVPAILDDLRVLVNAQFQTNYTEENFVGSNHYKHCYALAQKIQQNETKAAEIFQKLQDYIASTNEAIQRPSVSAPGVLDSLASQGFVASVKPPIVEDAGTASVCVDLDDEADGYALKKLEVCTLLSQYYAAGIVTLGDEEESIVLSNGQSFDFKYTLPNRIPVLLRLTAIESENNLLVVPSDEVIREKIFDNARASYRLGLNFEPQRYYTLADAPWAATLLLEWSDDDGETWHDEVYDADFDDLFEFALEDIEVVIT